MYLDHEGNHKDDISLSWDLGSGLFFYILYSFYIPYSIFYILFRRQNLFCRHTASAPITSGTHTGTGGGAVIWKPGSAWLEGTPAMDLGHMNVVLKWMCLCVDSGLRNKNSYFH